MADTRDALRSITESIEHELKRLDIWDEEAPSAEALKSQEPFCFGTLGFAQWMQLIACWRKSRACWSAGIRDLLLARLRLWR